MTKCFLFSAFVVLSNSYFCSGTDTQLIDDACDELKHSTRLRQLLGIVLQFGNRLNTAGKSRQHKAGAFTLDSLLKLSQAKAFDKKTTFLHYVVMIVHRNNEILLNFTDDLPTCMRADKIYWDQCLQDLEEVENQLENVRRISLYEAKARKNNLRSLNKKDDDEDSIGDLELSLEEEVEALRATPTGLFTLSAIKQVSALRDKVESTRKKFVRVLEYFGEDQDSMQPHELFNIFCVFGRDFNKAKEEAFASMKKKQREERKQAGRNPQQKINNGMKGKPPSGPERKTLRASNLQPNMSKVMNDLRSPAKQPVQRPDHSHLQASPHPPPPRKEYHTQDASRIPDQLRPAGSPVDQHLQLQANPEISRVSPTKRMTTYAARQHAPQSMNPDADTPGPRGVQESAQLHGAPNRSGAPLQPIPSQQSAAESLRQKALDRGQHAQTVLGRTTPFSSNALTSESRSPRSSPMSSSEHSSSIPNESVVGSATALASRASMRHRRMQAIKRVNAAKGGQSRNDWGASSQVSSY
jgi:Formin Homology 2 Domain